MSTPPLRWTQDHLVRITATLICSSETAADAVETSLAAWFTTCTPDRESALPVGRAALSGGSALERHRAGTAHLVVITSGGEDGLDSAGWELERLRQLRADVDPAGMLSVIEQWRHEDESIWHPAPGR